MADAARVFPKRWGADFIGAGKVRFRIWAPGLESLTLRLDGNDAAMSRDEEGWFELTVTGVEAGARYGFVLPDGRVVPDPAARAQDGDVHAASLVVDPAAYAWRETRWKGRPWREAVIYELHVGTFTPEGTFRAAAERLEHLSALGVTVVELMPVGQFSGQRGWGYDGVLPYAPHSAYGSPDDLKHLVDEAHTHGLMVMLDVVYNHFGPDGNYLPAYAPAFFEEKRCTPWGQAIAYRRRPVRQFFIDNAVYWLKEFSFDGLRLDAVDQIVDGSQPDFLAGLAWQARRDCPGRHVHLVTEDNRNVTYLHERSDGRCACYTAEWNDDFHHAAHVLLTGEDEGYYGDFAQDALGKLGRCLAEGFAFQGEPSLHAGGKPRGEPSAHLPPTAFVDFLQNHDQVGNRAHGERLSTLARKERLDALTAVLLLSPHIPLIFMGEEWGETRPFRFFTDYANELAEEIREGRCGEFAAFTEFGTRQEAGGIPDPNAEETFEASKLDWDMARTPQSHARLSFLMKLLALRQRHVVPLLHDGRSAPGRVMRARDDMLAIDWPLTGGTLQLRANLGEKARHLPAVAGEIVHAVTPLPQEGDLKLPPRSVAVAVAR